MASTVPGLSPAEKRARLEQLLKQGRPEQRQAALKRTPRKEAPLSFAQERIYFLDQLSPLSADFNIVLPLELQGPFSVPLLTRALEEVVRRHEILRTRFQSREGTVWQVIESPLPLELPGVDLSGLAPEARDREYQRLSAEEMWRGFPLERAPLFRVRLFRLAPEAHRLVFTLHNLINDGMTPALLLSELCALYRAYEEDLPSPLPELAVQYADVAVWERERFAAGELEPSLAWWEKRLTPLPPPVHLSGRVPERPTYEKGICLRPVGPATSAGVRELSRALNVTPFMVLQAAFLTLLYRHSGQQELCVGSALSPRRRPELEPLLGCFQNTLILRAQLSATLTVRQLLTQVRLNTLEAVAHQDAPIDKVVQRVQPSRSLGENPLARHLIGLVPHPAASQLRLGQATVRVQVADVGQTKFELGLQIIEHPDGAFEILSNYRKELFEEGAVERLLSHYQALLEGMIRDPSCPLGELPLLGEEERQQVLHQWNPPRTEGWWSTSFPALFEAQVARRPEAVAAASGGEGWTYSQLERRSGAVAGQLRALGAAPEQIVPVLAERGLGLIGAVVGITRTGAAFQLVDPRQPPERIREVLEQSGARWLLVDAAHQALAEATLAGMARPPQRLGLEPLLEGPAPSAPLPPPGGGPESLAYVLSTSGSTGKPKGVMVRRRGMLNHLQAKTQRMGVGEGDVVAQTAAQSFDIIVWQMLCALAVGGRVVVLGENALFDPAQLLAEVQRWEVSVWQMVPSIMAAALDAADRAGDQAPALPRLSRISCGGEALPPALAARWRARFPHTTLVNEYGPAEGSDVVATYPVEEGLRGGTTPIGRPIPNARLYVLDPQLQPVPVGAEGELCIGGLPVARGYLGNPAGTAERFVPDPYGAEPGARLYRTGDLARRRPDGLLELLGRVDHQVKLRGIRIELGEVEAALLRQPGVREAAVLAREDSPGDKRLVAYAVGEGLDPETLRRGLARALPEFMVPSACVLLERLPVTANGKLDRPALPAPVARTPGAGPQVQASAVEQQLAVIWQELLGGPLPGVQDNFFELGGHSLLIGALVHQVQARIGPRLSMRAIFEAPTISELAQLLAREGAQG